LDRSRRRRARKQLFARLSDDQACSDPFVTSTTQSVQLGAHGVERLLHSGGSRRSRTAAALAVATGMLTQFGVEVGDAIGGGGTLHLVVGSQIGW